MNLPSRNKPFKKNEISPPPLSIFSGHHTDISQFYIFFLSYF
jgi:hypothetical protein